MSNIGNNLILVYSLGDDQLQALRNLEKEVLEKHSQKSSLSLMEFYRSINYNTSAYDSYPVVIKRLSSYVYNKKDLQTVIQNELNKYLSQSKTPCCGGPVGYHCVDECQETANAEYNYLIEESQPGSVARNILLAEKAAYFRGCYDRCILDSGGQY